MKVEQMMSRPVATCTADDTANQAAQLMWEQDIGCVVVIDDSQQVKGIVTDRDLCMAAYTKGLALSQIPLRDVMATSVAVVRPNDLLAKAEALMRTKKVRRLPVVDATDRLVGLLSLNDVVREAQQQRGRPIPAVGGDEVVSTLGAICEPRQAHDLMPRA